ncbi:hypothetical protein [Bacillus altitudinis]|uniref:hypothetical protein n=1 Tax=Bacillus altitudinis TaxID=293387 RepID=UPI0019345000|nr:hypothetical protein [Bacillus altitudinis]QRF85501.1 hypothetical protein JNE42_19405 [Bacillus altitudinis]UUH76261.1 hypothetical protein NP445_19465 [Bacillus altitudinis]
MRSNGLTVGGFGQSPKRVTGEPVPTYAPKVARVFSLRSKQNARALYRWEIDEKLWWRW